MSPAGLLPRVCRRAAADAAGRAVGAALALAIALGAPQAAAFELFGKTFFGGKSEEARLPVPDPTAYTVAFTVRGADAALERRLRESSTLLGEQENPPSGLIGVIARARADRSGLVAELYGAGHYGGTVAVTVDGVPIDELEIDPDRRVGRPVPVRVAVEVGPVFRFDALSIAVAGGGREDPAAYGLVAGEIARSELVVAAETLLVRAFRERGHPFAEIADKDIVADHDRRTLDVAITVEPGPSASFGAVTVKGAEKVEPDFIATYANLPRGEPYDPRAVRRAAERLRKLGLFRRIGIEPAGALAPDGSIPMVITVAEGKQRTIGAGATIDSEDGLGIEGYWRHRNLFGRAERLGVEAAIGRLGNVTSLQEVKLRTAVTFAKPGMFGPATTFTSSLAVEFEKPEAFRRAAVVGEAGISYDIDDFQTVSIGVEAEYSDIEDAFGDSRHLLLGLPIGYARDTRDDRLDPTTGYRFVSYVEPFYDFSQSVGFARLGATLSGYRAVDPSGRVVMAAKIGAGTIVGANALQVAANKRMYAGGANSVRGYGFQQAGPASADGTPLGGLTKVEGSIEARIGVTEKIGVVPFFDAGGVFDTATAGFGDDIQYGAGLGLRYKTPIGPLRLDVALPINPDRGDDRFAVYVGLGHAF